MTKNYRQFLISDTHFGHKNIIKFTNKKGERIRPFDSVEQMDELMVDNWNSVVKEQDTVYHLGDVVINRRALPIMERLNGRKVLIKGNHDIFKLKEYTKYFSDIRAYKVLPQYDIIMSHIPIHTNQFSRWKLNIHGHLHQNYVKTWYGLKDKRYRNVCVEQINYTPILLEDILHEQGIS